MAVIFGHQFYPANDGAATAPQTIECQFSFLENIVSQDSQTRIENMDAYYDIVNAANAAMSSINVQVRLNSFGWAINTGAAIRTFLSWPKVRCKPGSLSRARSIASTAYIAYHDASPSCLLAENVPSLGSTPTDMRGLAPLYGSTR